MADWNLSMSYNFNSPYHMYAYGLMYPPGAEQNHTGMGWHGAARNHGGVPAAGYYSAPQTPVQAPEEGEGTNAYPGSVLYLADSSSGPNNAGRFIVSHGRAPFAPCVPERQCKGTNSATTSDSEEHTPDSALDSWSPAAAHQGCNPPSWTGKEQEEKPSGSPDSCEAVSSSLTMSEETSMPKEEECEQAFASVPSPASPQEESLPSRPVKTRTAFSDCQLNALVERFSVQRYLMPAEMKTLACITGLTYKQVKTWFQNRRMKWKRQQKDTSWRSERYPNSGYTGVPHTRFQVNQPPGIPDNQCTQQYRDAMYRNGSASPYYPNYPRQSLLDQQPLRVQGDWTPPPGFPCGNPYTPSNHTSCMNGSGDEGPQLEAPDSPSPMAITHTASQWDT